MLLPGNMPPAGAAAAAATGLVLPMLKLPLLLACCLE